MSGDYNPGYAPALTVLSAAAMWRPKTLIIVANQVDIVPSKAHLGIKKDISNKKELSMSVMDRKRRVYD